MTPFSTPILLIVFNRPALTRKVFEQMKIIKPLHLFIAADGPRTGRPEDSQKCASTRAIFEEIDWPCEVRTLYRIENKGCGYGPAEAITWFFDQVKEGIILEDDCLADHTFFPYCEELLIKYQNDERVYMITGTNALNTWRFGNNTYFFSYMANSLGWASWRRAWQHFDYTMQRWTTPEGRLQIRRTLAHPAYFEHFSRTFTSYQLTQPDDVWDFQWLFARWVNGGYTITPAVNLIRNLGFQPDATHSFNENDPLAKLRLHPARFPLRASSNKVDKLFDWLVFERFINPAQRPLWKKIVLKVLKFTTQSR